MDGLRVAIVGGGIGGLSAALSLHRFGHHPVLVEQTRELRPVGAGISLWPNGIKVLNLLGLGTEDRRHRRDDGADGLRQLGRSIPARLPALPTCTNASGSGPGPWPGPTCRTS